MFLYNLTLQPASSVSTAIIGNFSGTKTQELVLARHQHLELWNIDTTTGKLSLKHRQPAFSHIRSLSSFRLTGSSKDHIVLGSDAGSAALIEYSEQTGFVQAQYHEFGRTGVRRMVPGQYVAADPRGRAFMVAATERAKIIYVVTRDSEAKVALGSPLEANRAEAVCFDVVGVDVGYENPVFAALECVGMGPKQVVYYELDLGLNHVVRSWSSDVHESASRLVALPGGGDGPSGVLVCGEGFVEYRGPAVESSLRVELPRRAGDEGRGALVVASAVHRMKGAFFILLQSESGDLFKATVDYEAATATATRLGIAYFDTIAPASCLCILRAGFLFAGSAGDGGSSLRLFQFENLGVDAEAGEFEPQPLRSLALVDEAESLCPMVRSQVLNLTDEDAPQIYALCGRGAQSALRIVRHGLEAAELAVSELPGTPQAVWAIARSGSGDGGQLIVVSFRDATLVLGVADEVTEVTDSGLLTTEPTLALHQCAAGGTVQATPRALRRTYADARAAEWLPPRGLRITAAALNSRQAIVTYGGERAAVFLLDAQDELRETAEPLVAGSEIVCVALPQVAHGRRQAPFAAVGCADQTVRVFALKEGGPEPVAVQAVADHPESVVLVYTPLGLMLFVGLRNGLLVRAAVDEITGELSDPRTRFLGARPVRLRECSLGAGGAGVVALSSQPWLCHAYQGRLRTVPLSYDALDDACAFQSPQGPGLVAISAGSLRILAVDRLDAEFNHAAIPLQHTPRDFALNPQSRHFAVIETDNMGSGSWASVLRVLNPFDGETTCLVELDADEAAVSMALVSFATTDGLFLAVGCATGMTLRPRSSRSACLRLFRWSDDGTQLVLEHLTPLDDIPQALLPFNGQLLVALGRTLRLYDMGKRQVLKKAQTLVAPCLITALHAHPTQKQRVFVCDAQESVQLAVFSSSARQFHVVVDDSLPRYTTSVHVLDDGATVVGGDKFGNLFVLRCPETVSSALDADPEGGQLIYEKPRMGASANRWVSVAEFHVGDIVTSVTTCALSPGGRQVILYSTLLGSLAAAIPFVSKSDIGFFQSLELLMRKHYPVVSGRDHLKYRSSFQPVRSAIDGDLCELYHTLSDEARESISDALDRTQQDIFKKLEDMRTMFTF
ncbi:pre-mRNA-splicing factor rse1 [Kickxella alabastrina]|uniref:Pre-mRNA-splicing factor rse1 n=1 Tax=Kickxella alabastrina TaxID=61397 RepID=A0ACC1IRA6_9FUNG|nr:pre-mRNA-splicing factor rse1 [Kickxella alabastrina]